MIDRRLFIGTLTAVLIPATSVLGAVSTPQDTLIAVVRSPDCGCCGAWIDHLRQSGFIVEETLSDDVGAFKGEQAVPQSLRSCHTVPVHAYVIGVHVRADAIRDELVTQGIVVEDGPTGSRWRRA